VGLELTSSRVIELGNARVSRIGCGVSGEIDTRSSMLDARWGRRRKRR